MAGNYDLKLYIKYYPDSEEFSVELKSSILEDYLGDSGVKLADVQKVVKRLLKRWENIKLQVSGKPLFVLKGEHRMAQIRMGAYLVKGKYVVDFYYDGHPDFEWKKGAHGMSCDICDTLEQAKRKARRYVNFDKLM